MHTLTLNIQLRDKDYCTGCPCLSFNYENDDGICGMGYEFGKSIRITNGEELQPRPDTCKESEAKNANG